MAPLLHPNAFSGNWGTNRHFTRNAVDDLANTLLQELNQLCVHYFMCRATKFAFDALSPQARYGLNLMALMVEVKRYVDLHPLEGKTLVYISTRATKCLPRGWIGKSITTTASTSWEAASS